jgi:hypothetical protein
MENILMKRVILTELLPGMVLAKPVANSAGLPVVAEGAILDDVMIARFKKLSLASVYVEGEAETAGGKTLAELEVELEHRFRHVCHDPLQQTILTALREYLHSTHGTADIEKGASAS